ncbi:hypothetical protein ABTY35_29670 [Streptomyces fimicarius]|uniref:hypothetical protein n=1 Tax=Streptomyces TaxID=1883 RepID=UPI0004AA3120|nr:MULTISPECIES: hypothetical protein [Streptomyces]
MSNGVAYPVLRTPDLDLALRAARQMVVFGAQRCSEVSVEAEVPTVAEVGRLRDVLPDAWFTCENVDAPVVPPPGIPDLTCSVPACELPDNLADTRAYLPLTASMLDQPPGSIEDHFAAVIGPHPAEIRWSSLSWPEAPERDLYGESTHAEVTLLLNCDSRELDARADTHLLLVHVRRHDEDGYEERFAEWLAEQIGQKVIGAPQHS